MKTDGFQSRYIKSKSKMIIIGKKFNSRKNIKMLKYQNNTLILKKNKKNK